MEFLLGPHHGIMYRRAELKELIAMHSAHGELGGDLKKDTIVIVSSALDLQEKVCTLYAIHQTKIRMIDHGKNL